MRQSIIILFILLFNHSSYSKDSIPTYKEDIDGLYQYVDKSIGTPDLLNYSCQAYLVSINFEFKSFIIVDKNMGRIQYTDFFIKANGQGNTIWIKPQGYWENGQGDWYEISQQTDCLFFTLKSNKDGYVKIIQQFIFKKINEIQTYNQTN